jgi:DNA polymerase-3 subunit beta
MDLVAEKKSLVRLLQRCQGVADKRSTMPVLANVLLRAEEGQLHVAATDLFLALSGNTEATVHATGAVALPARDLFERVKAMPEGEIRLSVREGGATTIQAVGSARRYTLHGLPGADFPALPQPAKDATVLDLSVAHLGQLIARTHFSVSSDETRPHLNSALFQCDKGHVRMVTTDGHRLSKMEIALEGLTATTTMLLPLKAITELRRLTDEITGDRDTTMVQVRQTGPNAFFDLSDIRFSVKLVDAQFPPYEQVIPAATDRAIRAPRAAFAEALRAVALAASDRTGGVKLAAAENILRVTSESPESGNGFDELEVDYAGPELSVGFNARYLLDVLGSIDTDEITLGLSGELDPAVVKPGDGTTDLYVAVVMPMRI